MVFAGASLLLAAVVAAPDLLILISDLSDFGLAYPRG